MQVSVAEHERIIQAFLDHDADQAEQLVRKSAEYGGKALMAGSDKPLPVPLPQLDL
jgi:DNA-binding GntR family transcriptional regulator